MIVIEHVWEELARKFEKLIFKNVEKFEVAIKKEWDNISQKFGANGIHSIPRHLQAATLFLWSKEVKYIYAQSPDQTIG